MYLENQKKMVNENINKEQININKITYFLMKNKWFEKAKSVDTKINYINNIHLPIGFFLDQE